MFRIRERFAELRQRRKFVSAITPSVAVFLVFANWVTLRSFVIGFGALIVYMVVNGDVFGRVFFEDEKPFFRLIFGLFAFIVVLALAEIAAVFLLMNELWFLLGLIFAAGFSFFLNVFFVKYDVSQANNGRRRRLHFDFLYVLWGAYLVLLVVCFYLLFSVRSGWVKGPIWGIIPPVFLQVYFVATAVLVGIVLLGEKVYGKLLLIVLHSVFSLSFIFVVSYPGIIFYDPWYDFGRATAVLSAFRVAASQSFSIRALNSFLRGYTEHVLVAGFASTLCIEMYWSYLLFMPLLWGIFVPLSTYKITRMIGGDKRASLFAGFLSLVSLYFLAWGKLTEASSLSILFFFLLVYLLLRFLSSGGIKIFLLIVAVFLAMGAAHFLAFIVGGPVVLIVLALKTYERTRLKSSIMGYLSLTFSFLISVLVVPSAVILRGVLLPMLGTSAYSVEKLLDSGIWALVFGFSGEQPVQEALLYDILPLLGLIGLVYALQRKEKYDRTLCQFLFLVFGLTLIDYRILEYAVVGGIFSAGRLKVFSEIVALPFVALVVASATMTLFSGASKRKLIPKSKDILVGILFCLSLSAWTTAAVYKTYEDYTKGLLPTALEVEAIKYVDEHTNSGYVVLAPHPIAVMSWGYLGIPNLEKQYVSLGKVGIPADPSTRVMSDSLKSIGADIGYFMVSSSRTSDFNKIVAEASKIFGLFKLLSDENGEEIHVFHYKIPPLPTDENVFAFYWDTPPAYYIQNDLVRVVVNPTTVTLDVVDFFGDLYQGVDFSKTLVNGNPLGNLTSIEYFDNASNTWFQWNPQTPFLNAEQFQFKLRFESDSLIGVIEKGISSVRLWWEGGQSSTWSFETGAFTHMYIPGLVEGEDSYDVISREYGFLYTRSLTDDVVLQPAYKPDMTNTSLTYNEVSTYCGFNRTQASFWYDVYVENTLDVDQWAYVEIWLPDEVYTGSFPPLRYSIDGGETWINPLYNPETESSQSIRTLGGVDVSWIFTVPKNAREMPRKWWSFETAAGGFPMLPNNYKDSGGGQNRMIYGFYLPAGDKILVRLGCAAWYISSLQLSYVFIDSNDIYYGLKNMENALIELYNVGTPTYIGGVWSSKIPTTLAVTQDESYKINFLLVDFPANTTISLLSQGV